jgi:hydrogenase nickel incorporation protein HypA/HybF
MHEMSVAMEIIESIMEIAPQFENKPVKTVFLKIGKLSNIVVDSLQFCYDTVKSDYEILANSTLSIEIVPIRGECRQCGYRFEITDMFFICPNCSGGNVRLEQGQELEISELEVEE